MMGMDEGRRDDEATFVGQPSTLLDSSALTAVQKAATLRSTAETFEALAHPPSCRVVPFTPGRRPTGELAHAGQPALDTSAHGSIRDRIRQRFLAPTR